MRDVRELDCGCHWNEDADYRDGLMVDLSSLVMCSIHENAEAVLTALEQILADHSCMKDVCEACDAGHAAIAKARGDK